jgi:phosphomannomutase
MGEIKFGTDGWRAVIAADFTFANLDRVTQAAADYWKNAVAPGTEKRIVTGYDRRFLSPAFARRAAEIFAANGFEVILTDAPTPTPAVSLAVKALNAAGGVMITASHNPPAFNGFKLKAHYGGSADPSICQAVEKCLDRNPVPSSKGEARAVKIKDLRAPHFSAIKKLVDFKLVAASKLKFAHDALFGVGAGASTLCWVEPPAKSPL